MHAVRIGYGSDTKGCVVGFFGLVEVGDWTARFDTGHSLHQHTVHRGAVQALLHCGLWEVGIELAFRVV